MESEDAVNGARTSYLGSYSKMMHICLIDDHYYVIKQFLICLRCLPIFVACLR